MSSLLDYLCCRYSFNSLKNLISFLSDTCKIVSQFTNQFKDCNGGYSYSAEETRDFSRDLTSSSWQTRDHNQTCAVGTKHEFCHNSASDLDGFLYVGQWQLYAGGGYVLQLRGEKLFLISSIRFNLKVNSNLESLIYNCEI